MFPVKATTQIYLVQLFTETVLILYCLLPFLVPFGLTRDLYLQSCVVILSGVLGWAAVVMQRRRFHLPRPVAVLLAIYLFACLLSLLAHPSRLNLWGSPLMLLGTPALLAMAGSGLALQTVQAGKLVSWLYTSLVGLAIASIPYSLWNDHLRGRLGGLLHQPDFLAVCLGIGLILGTELWRQSAQRKWLIGSQLFLLFTLFLTQTRAVIVIVALVLLLMTARSGFTAKRKVFMGAAIVVTLALTLAGLKLYAPGRLTSVSYASDSISYRLNLQRFALQAVRREPVTGYGAGSVLKALPCSSLHNPALQKTCHSGYYFDSSHNVYLDRVLEFGWLGGLSFAGLMAWGLWHGLRSRGPERVLAYCLLIVAAYFFTNPSDFEIEMLSWVFLLRPYATIKPNEKVPA